MIFKLELELSEIAIDDHIYQLSSVMQGVLMERVEPQYADFLHQNNLHPYSQNIIKKDGRVYWNISALNAEAKKQIADPWLDPSVTEIYLKQKNKTLQIQKKRSIEISYQQLLKQYLFEEKERIIRIKFETPTSFKQNGQYCIFPTVRLIFQSLMHRYDACAADTSSFDEEILEHYEKYAHIVRYRLRSTSFSLEGVRVPAFIGEITIKVSGPQQMVNLAHMLLQFGTYAGVGIKTAIGMGSLELL